MVDVGEETKELTFEMAEEGEVTSIRLQMPDEMYQRVRHAAVDERTNASAWIRDAIERKLGDVPQDGRLAELCGAWDAMGDEARGHVLWLARSVVDAPGNKRPGRA